MKNPFKKSSAVDTLINVGIGGAANVAMNYLFSLIPAGTFGNNEETVKNAIKVAVGAVGGSMVGGKSAKYVRPALDGIATVGASELISSLIPAATSSDSATTVPASGVPFIGRAGRRLGQRGFRKVTGTGSVSFMEP